MLRRSSRLRLPAGWSRRRGLGLLRIDGRRVARRPLAASGWRALLARFLALFLVLAGLLLRRLFLALAQQFLDQGLVALRGDQLRLALQGLFVGVDGGFQFALAGQGVATVVVIVGLVALGEGLGRGGVVAGLVERQAFPAEVLEALRRLVRLAPLQQALALLVRTQPEVFELEGHGRLRQAQHQQRQAEQPAAPSGTGGQQEQRQEQPVTLVGPALQAQQGVLAIFLQRAAAGQQAEAVEVAVVRPQALVAGADLRGEAAQSAFVEPGQEDAALVVLEEAAILLLHRSALRRADAEHGEARRPVLEGAADALALGFAQLAGQQQQAAAALGALFQQVEGLAHGEGPGSGMIEGFRASSRLRAVSWSSDSGTRVCALPA